MTVTDTTTVRLVDGDIIVIAHMQEGKARARAFTVPSDGQLEERTLTPSDWVIVKALIKTHTAKRED